MLKIELRNLLNLLDTVSDRIWFGQVVFYLLSRTISQHVLTRIDTAKQIAGEKTRIPFFEVRARAKQIDRIWLLQNNLINSINFTAMFHHLHLPLTNLYQWVCGPTEDRLFLDTVSVSVFHKSPLTCWSFSICNFNGYTCTCM